MRNRGGKKEDQKQGDDQGSWEETPGKKLKNLTEIVAKEMERFRWV